MPLRAIDFHVHLPTPDWLDGSMAGYVEAAEAYFRSPVQRQSLAKLAARYRGLGLMAVLLVWDAETATGGPRVPTCGASGQSLKRQLTAVWGLDYDSLLPKGGVSSLAWPPDSDDHRCLLELSW